MKNELIIEEIRRLAKENYESVKDYRRHIHANPELSKEEHKTAAYIASQLDELGISYKEKIAGTGIVAIIRSEKHHAKTIALRADMDALPIEEANTHSYVSKNKGVMHACGHDAHIACLLGAAKILQQLKKHLNCNVKLFFQPSEETYPGGAIEMIKAGVMNNPPVVHVFALHVDPEIPVGKIGIKPGLYMASTDEVHINVKGKGGHAAMPDLLNDPVYASAQLLVALQQIVSRNIPPNIPSVLTFGKIEAKGRTNIVPHEVKLEGTLRTFSQEWRVIAHKRIQEICDGIAKACGLKINLNIAHGYPFLNNDEGLTQKVKTAAIQYLGKDQVIDIDARMTAEDFAYFAEKTPSCFFRLGTRNEAKGITHNLHTPKFDIDEEALVHGSGLMAALAFSL